MRVIRSKDGTQIAYEHRGDGPALLVVGGALNARMSGSKADLVDLVAPELSVYCYDRRGRATAGTRFPTPSNARSRISRRWSMKPGESPPSTAIRRAGASP